LGLTSGYTTVRGSNAEFTVNGGDVLSSSSNVLDGDALGIEGLSVTVNSETSQTVEVAGNTKAMRGAIDKFISAFNDVQKYIDAETKISKSADGKVTTAVLAGNQEVEGWASRLRSLAFSQVSGLTGTISRLENLGIDFNSSSSTLTVKDSSKLDKALTNNAADVAAFFSTPKTGFSAVLDSYLGKTLDERSGGLATQVSSLNKQNTSIDEQIEALNRRIENQRVILTDAFIAMQNAQSKANTQQTALDNMLKQMNKSSS
jgi:flagellar hook-associated protein 2